MPAGGGLSVMFVVPRFHANLWFATRVLIDAGHRVTVLSETQGAAEDRRTVAPRFVGPAPGSAILSGVFQDAQPDLVLLRNTSALKRPVAALARQAGTACRLCDQRPLTERRGWRHRLALRLSGLPLRRVTPVPGLDPEAPRDRDATYLPWPVERDPNVPLVRGTGPVTVLCVGKLGERRKNQHLVVEALREHGRAGRVRLQIVGASGTGAGGTGASGFDAAYLAYLEAAAAESWIDLRRDVSFAEMPALYAGADICVLPSVHEPLGTAPVEAMAYGAVPVISTGAGSAGYLTEGRDGLRVDVNEPGALATALQQVVNDAPYRARLAAGARATAESELGPARFLERIEALAAEG